jgi:hypothetical protein
MVKEGLGWRQFTLLVVSVVQKTLTLTLILVAFGLVSCQKKVPEQAAKRDMSFYPLGLGKSLT